MVLVFVFGPVQYGHPTNGQLTQPGREDKIASHRTQETVPAQGIGRAVQEHPIQVEESTPATLPDSLHNETGFTKVWGLVGNAGHQE
ncbi:hypothetical protein MHY01S_19630 [Meiothermus hypogaeus NBRC 106114]|uniref:Uncharacterized protein n=1 Tax=Meiothermus hypogaeus NBRC 106114 TaxID=1227553 RepID=A0A511R398_9DEIN|nr:hypothetical protein MHY01S_19630 [Meiothermus hypogaeus NBRC 106114]